MFYTYENLLPAKYMQTEGYKYFKNVSPMTPSYLYLLVGMKGNAEELEIPPFLVFFLESHN